MDPFREIVGLLVDSQIPIPAVFPADTHVSPSQMVHDNISGKDLANNNLPLTCPYLPTSYFNGYPVLP